MIEQTRFLSTVFLRSEPKLEYLLWSKFLREFLFAGTYFCGSLENRKNRENKNPQKIRATRYVEDIVVRGQFCAEVIT